MRTLQSPVYTIEEFKAYIQPSVVRYMETILRDGNMEELFNDGIEPLTVDNLKKFIARHFLDFNFPKGPFIVDTGEMNAYCFVVGGGCEYFILGN